MNFSMFVVTKSTYLYESTHDLWLFNVVIFVFTIQFVPQTLNIGNNLVLLCLHVLRRSVKKTIHAK